MLQIEFDPKKDAANLARHGVSLALAAALDWDAALAWVDRRFGYDEMRMIALAPERWCLNRIRSTTPLLSTGSTSRAWRRGASSACAAPPATR